MWEIQHILSLALFCLFVLLSAYKLCKGLRQSLTNLHAWLRESWKNRILAAVVLSFMVFFILVNILPFNFVANNETDTQYDYSFYLNSHPELGLPGIHGTNIGGLFPVFSVLYGLAGIDSFLESTQFNKIVLSLIFLLTFYLVWSILRFFVQERKGEHTFTLLLAMLYLSFSQITFSYWTQKEYYLATQLMFFLSLFYIIDYLKTRSALSFVLSLMSSLLAFLSRPEFSIFAVLPFLIVLLDRFELTRFRFKNIDRREKLLLLLNILMIVSVFIISLDFVSSNSSRLYSDKKVLLELILFNTREHFQLLGYTFSTGVNILLLLLCASSIIFHSYKRRHVLLFLAFGLASSLPTIMTTYYDGQLQVFYSLFLFFIAFVHVVSWLLAKRARFGQIPFAAGIFISILIISSCYLVLSSKRLPLLTSWPGDGIFDKGDGIFDNYDRLDTLGQAEEARGFYELQKGRQAIIFEKYEGELYYKYVFAGTNNTFLRFEKLKEMNSTYLDDPRQKLVVVGPSVRECTREGVLLHVKGFFLDHDIRDGLDPENYNLVSAIINSSTIRSYAKHNNLLICEVIFPQE